MNHDYNRNTTITVNPGFLWPSMDPQFKIKFNFNFEYIQDQDQDSTTPLLINSTSSDVIDVGESLSFEDIGEAIEDAVFDHLLEDDRDVLIDLAWKEVSRVYPTIAIPKYLFLYICFQIRIEEPHVYMIPAADSSFAMLEKYEVKEKEEEEERCCCICLEELAGGGGALKKMPCSHVFHGGCVEEWLRTSHYCPLCRYEMPTQSIHEDDNGGLDRGL